MRSSGGIFYVKIMVRFLFSTRFILSRISYHKFAMHDLFSVSDGRNPEQVSGSGDSFYFSTRNTTPGTCSGCISENKLFTPMVRVQKIKIGYCKNDKWTNCSLSYLQICPCCERHLDAVWHVATPQQTLAQRSFYSVLSLVYTYVQCPRTRVRVQSLGMSAECPHTVHGQCLPARVENSRQKSVGLDVFAYSSCSFLSPAMCH
jgi:hypothetical protein